MKKNNCLSRRYFFKLAGLGVSTLAFPVSCIGRSSPSQSSNLTSNAKNMKLSSYTPPYIGLQQGGELKKRASILNSMMRSCTLCPRECETDRLAGRRGDCNARDTLEISSVTPHFGEERELVGSNGSGTIFFTNCSLLCVFCINYDISQYGRGRRRSIEFLADSMIKVQDMGCHNVNLVTPSHYAPHIVSAIDLAVGKGLKLPIVYNTCGWEKMEVLKLLDGVVDIYLADFKYFNPDSADKYSPGALSYPDITKQAILEMHRQVGVAKPDPNTRLINKGLMIRHLVMPNNVSDSDKIMKWIGSNLPSNTYINIMSQYTPVHKANKYPEINRRITQQEYQNAIDAAKAAGLSRVIRQGG